MESAQPPDRLDARTEVEVVSIAEKNLNPKILQQVLRHTLDGSQRPDGHEDRSLDYAVRGDQSSDAGGPAGSFDLKLEEHSQGL